jgi:hypothetical protein
VRGETRPQPNKIENKLIRSLQSIEMISISSARSVTMMGRWKNGHLTEVRSELYKLPIFYLPTGDTTKSAEDREVKEEEEEEEEE